MYDLEMIEELEKHTDLLTEIRALLYELVEVEKAEIAKFEERRRADEEKRTDTRSDTE